jgi:CubicO group peptidase (beta-lactamase class C family)
MNTNDILAERIPQLCEQTGVTGVAVATVQDGEPAYAQAFGSLSRETPLPVASLTKPIFAYAVLKLCKRGLIDLDTLLTEYLPEPYLVDEPFLPLITARHALSHATGFPNWRTETGLRAAFRPGTAFHYSTEGLIYLQTVVERLTNRPLQNHLVEDIFVPLGMTSS